MNLFQSLFLAVVQGITEFLPISSSGHLVLFQKLFKIGSPPVFFDILLHFGTLLAIIYFFKNEILSLFSDWKNKIGFWFLIFIASVPIALLGFFLHSRLETIFNSLRAVGFFWVLSGVMILLTKKYNNGSKKENLSKTDALVIGLFQAVALFPGLSRSGATISGGIFRRLSFSLVFSFSFLLSVPATLGAVVLEFSQNDFSGRNWSVDLLSMAIAGITGYFALKLVKKTVVSQKFYLFGYYCLLLGTIVLIFA